MNLEIQEQCLLCLTSIVKTEPGVASNHVTKVETGYEFPSVNSFQELCEYLKIEFPLNSLKFKNVSRLLTGPSNESGSCCESLLCSKCLEMVNGLCLIYSDLRRVQRRIDYEIRAIQEVVKRTDKGVGQDEDDAKKDIKESSSQSSSSGRGGVTEEGGDLQQDSKRRKIERKNSGSGGVSSSIVADYMEFVDTFRTLVKEVKTEEPEPVVLSDEAETLAKFYEEMEATPPESQVEYKEEGEIAPSSSSSEIPSNERPGTSNGTAQPTTVYYIINGNSGIASGSNGNALTILPKVGVPTEEEDDEEDSQQNSVEVEVTIAEDEEMDYLLSPCSSVSFDPLSTSPLSNRKSRAINLTCRFCNQTFDSPIAYYKHRKSVHAAQSKALIIPSFNGSTPTPNRTGSCPLCWENVITRKNTFLQFMEHMLSHELLTSPITTVSEDNVGLPDDVKPYSCNHCDQRFLLEMNLDLHKICYHESNLIQLRCKECGDVSSESWEDLVTHLVEQHDCNIFYSCKSCPMAFITADKLVEHMGTHKLSKRLPCSECSSVSPSLKELYQHYNQAHPNLLTPLKCDICQETFSMPSTFKSHLSRGHLPSIPSTSSSLIISPVDPAQQNVQCPHCLEVKIFKNKTTLENHIRIHHDTTVDKHRCDECGKAFVHRSTLRYHMQQVHLGIRYPCPECPKSFTAKSLLKGHLKLHTGQGPPVIPCPHCGKIMASLTALKTHISTQHEDNKPVKCDICGREFSNLYSLRGHKSDIHNLKQFPCPHCPLSFAWLRKFNQHLRTAHPNQSVEDEMFQGAPPIQILSVGSVNGFNVTI